MNWLRPAMAVAGAVVLVVAGVFALGQIQAGFVGISTSGKSASVNRALQLARELNLVTVGFSGKDGGKLPSLCDFCFTVPSFSLHRIQECHEVLLHILWDMIHLRRGQEDVL